MKKNVFKECKNYIFAIGVLMLLLFGMTSQAKATPQLELGSATILQGGTGTLNLSLSGGTESYAGVNAKIVLPDGITVTGISNGELLPAGFKSDFHLSGNEVSVIAYSGEKTFSASEGILLLLNIEASADVATGTYDLQFADSDSLINSNALSNSDGAPSIKPTTSDGKITISQCEDTDDDDLCDSWEIEYFGDLNQDGTGDYDGDGDTNEKEESNGTNPTIKQVEDGDLNNDHNITVADAIIGLKIICGMNPGTFELSADINGDKKIGLEEVVFILQRVAGMR